jgi:hypothetical protein
MATIEQAARQALEALGESWHLIPKPDYARLAIDALRNALEQKPRQEPVTTDGWLQADGLLYRLTDDRRQSNRDEISVTMADGSRSIEARTRRAEELLDRMTAPAPQAAIEQEPVREWVGLTEEEIQQGLKETWVTEQAFESAIWWAEQKLKKKNGV